MSSARTQTATTDLPPGVETPDPGGNGREAGGAVRTVPHLTLNERAARGRAERAEVPRSSHAAFEPSVGRRDPVELLEEQAQTREPSLVPLRYGRMIVSPFTFFRGGAYLMAADLAGLPRTGLDAQLCGDAHLSNFGVYAAPDRRLVFSVNDFDETLPGPFEWDVKRPAASFAVAGRDRGFDTAERKRVNTAVTRAYRESMRELAGRRNLDLWYARIDIEDVIREFTAVRATGKQRKRFEANLAKTRAKDSLKAFSKLTEMVNGEPRIVSDPPLLVPIEELAAPGELETMDALVHSVIRSYRDTLPADRRRLLERFRYAHAARKVVGVGSVGTRAGIALMIGRDNDDPLSLDLKEAEASFLEPFLGPSEFPDHVQRVVEGQRLMQSASDLMLGWVRIQRADGPARDFYVRQLWDAKGSALVEALEPDIMAIYARLCGWTLAKAHARSGDAVAIAGYLGSGNTFDRALAAFAEAYADQNERDYAAVRAAVASGRIVAKNGI